MKSQPRRILIVYPYFAHYRAPVLKELALRGASEYAFASGVSTDIPNLKLIDASCFGDALQTGNWIELDNRWLYGPILWQRGLLPCLLQRWDTVIFLGSMFYLSTWAGALLLRALRRRVVFWGHGFYGNESGVKRWARRLFCQLPNEHLLYGNYARDLMIGMGFDGAALHVVYNSLDSAKQRALWVARGVHWPKELRQLMGLSDEARVICFVGRLVPGKALEVLIEALALMRPHAQVVLQIIGDGPEKEALERQAASLGLAESVLFVGPCYDEERLGMLIGGADLVVSPGNVGLTAMHAFAFGTPVVTHGDPTRQMPEYEVIRPGVTGFFFQFGDSRDLATRCLDWFKRGIDRSKVAAACGEVIDRYYNPVRQRTIIEAVAVASGYSREKESDI
jgi:glycosyltransferase involved in cell wall biosynthesis